MSNIQVTLSYLQTHSDAFAAMALENISPFATIFIKSYHFPHPVNLKLITFLTFFHLKRNFDASEADRGNQFILFQQCFQLYSIIVLSFIHIFLIFYQIFSKLSSPDLLYVGEGLTVQQKGEESFCKKERVYIYDNSVNKYYLTFAFIQTLSKTFKQTTFENILIMNNFSFYLFSIIA